MEVSNVLVLRNPSTPDWTLSNFYFDGKEKGKGVEDEKRAIKKKGETCISLGIYNFGLRFSPKFSKEYYRDDEGNLILAKERKTPEQIAKYHTMHEMLWVLNVKDFEFILWHWGNTDEDTDGCYIVGSVFGKTKGKDGVLNSRKKYTEIYPILFRSIKEAEKAGKFVTVEYKEVA